MRIHIAGALAAAVLLSSSAAFAADPVGEVAPYDWSGFYVGAHAGYASGEVSVDNASFTVLGAPVGTPVDDFANYDVDGWLGGIQAGFQQQTGSFVWGVEADIAGGDISGDDGFVETEINWLATLRGRVGFAFDSFLLYGTGGVAFTETETGIPFGTDPSDEQVHTGWTVGGGVEMMIAENVSLKAEYLYVEFDDETYNTDIILGFFGTQGDVSFDSHIGRIGVNYRF